MEIYLVGGAVRDRLLNRAVHERDWVVVGGTVAELEAQGYKKVGKDFPVFLHPDTAEEYALARTERKTAPGYHGFDVYAEPDVSLEDDLLRRDLTINAIAQSAAGELIDPYNGQQDLADRKLRHISVAFREDPLRVLRVARFAARFHDLGFSVAAETMELMRDITASGELESLVAERIWKETEKALAETRPDIYLQVLRDCGALAVIFPELDRLFGVPQPAKWHPEIDTGVHVLMVMQMAAQLSESLDVRFAAMVHDLGKGTTDKQWWPTHRDHEKRSRKLIDAMCDRLTVPNRCRELALQVGEFHTLVHRAAELRPDTVLKLLKRVDVFRRPERFELFLLACEADARGRKGLENSAYPQADWLRAALAAALTVDNASIKAMGVSGPEFGTELDKARLAKITAALTEVRS